jgi:hypothetical protein
MSIEPRSEDVVIVGLRQLMVNIPQLMVLFENDAERIGPGYVDPVSSEDGPLYPHVRITRFDDGAAANGFSQEGEYKIDVFSKRSNEEAWQIYTWVKFAIHNKDIPGVTSCLCRETTATDAPFDKVAGAHHVAARYRTKYI